MLKTIFLGYNIGVTCMTFGWTQSIIITLSLKKGVLVMGIDEHALVMRYKDYFSAFLRNTTAERAGR